MIYFFSWIDPPIFSNFSTADFEAKFASILTLSLISPVPKIFNFVEFLFIILYFFNNSALRSSLVLIVFFIYVRLDIF